MVCVVILVIASFARMRRGSVPPVRLDLRAGQTERRGTHPPRDVTGPSATAVNANYRLARDPARVAEARRRALEDLEREDTRVPTDEATDPAFVASAAEKSLNAFFNFNGHMFDAYEALGIPAGSSPQAARDAFERTAPSARPESRAFLMEALRAIERRRA